MDKDGSKQGLWKMGKGRSERREGGSERVETSWQNWAAAPLFISLPLLLPGHQREDAALCINTSASLIGE